MKILSFSDLLLYAKGWIRFRNTNSFMLDMKILHKRLYGFWSNNPTYGILNAVERIIEELEDSNLKRCIKLSCMYKEAQKNAVYYNCSFDEALLREYISILTWARIKEDLKVNKVDYKKDKLIMYNDILGRTYKQNQNAFNKNWRKEDIVKSKF